MFKNILALLLSITICFSFVGCTSSNAENIYNINGENIWSGLYLNFSISTINQAVKKINDAQKEAGKPTIDDKKWANYKIDDKDAVSWVRDTVLQECKNYVVIDKKFKEYDLKLSEATKNDTKQYNDKIWQVFGSTYMANGVSFDTFKKATEYKDKKQEVFFKYYGKDGVEPVTDDQLKAEFTKNYYKIKRVSFDFTNADGTKMNDDQKAQLKSLLEGYLDQIKNGTSLEDIKKQYDDKIKQEKGETSDPEQKPTVNFEVVKNDTLSDAFKQALGGVEMGNPVLVEDDGKFVIAVAYDLSNDKEKFEEYRQELLYNLKEKDFDKVLVDWTKDYTVKTDDKLYKKYNPKNLRLTG